MKRKCTIKCFLKNPGRHSSQSPVSKSICMTFKIYIKSISLDYRKTKTLLFATINLIAIDAWALMTQIGQSDQSTFLIQIR